jgi:hypothetical protein
VLQLLFWTLKEPPKHARVHLSNLLCCGPLYVQHCITQCTQRYVVDTSDTCGLVVTGVRARPRMMQLINWRAIGVFRRIDDESMVRRDATRKRDRICRSRGSFISDKINAYKFNFNSFSTLTMILVQSPISIPSNAPEHCPVRPPTQSHALLLIVSLGN